MTLLTRTLAGVGLLMALAVFVAPPVSMAADSPQAAADISRAPTDLPPPITRRSPKHVTFNLEAIEKIGQLNKGATYDYWTFNGKVPGPFLRARVGDMVTINLKNATNSTMMHDIDLHAVNGPGGGAVATQVAPGETKSFTFKALVPGLYVYHCAVPVASHHISNGMYGMILVEPEDGLPKVDHEFYVMQGELYTEKPFGAKGLQEFSFDKLLNEQPEYFVFNGAVGSLTKDHPLHAKTGETVRIFFGDGGPNFTSSFHVIGTIFERAYQYGSLLTPPMKGVQTMTVPPGDAAIADIKLPVPGTFTIVDHALTRVEQGLVGHLIVDGPDNPAIFKPGNGNK